MKLPNIVTLGTKGENTHITWSIPTSFCIAVTFQMNYIEYVLSPFVPRALNIFLFVFFIPCIEGSVAGQECAKGEKHSSKSRKEWWKTGHIFRVGGSYKWKLTRLISTSMENGLINLSDFLDRCKGETSGRKLDMLFKTLGSGVANQHSVIKALGMIYVIHEEIMSSLQFL